MSITGDGKKLELQAPEGIKITAQGDLNLNAKKAIALKAGGGISLHCDDGIALHSSDLKHNGTNIGNSHVHGGVTPGGSKTGGPN